MGKKLLAALVGIIILLPASIAAGFCYVAYQAIQGYVRIISYLVF